MVPPAQAKQNGPATLDFLEHQRPGHVLRPFLALDLPFDDPHRELRAKVSKCALDPAAARDRRARRNPVGGEVSELDERINDDRHADPEIIDRRRGLVATANLELIFPHLRRANIDERTVDRSRELVETLAGIDRAQGSAQAAGAEWINRWRGRAH